MPMPLILSWIMRPEAEQKGNHVMSGKRPMTQRERQMLSEEYKSSPNYNKFRTPKPQSGGSHAGPGVRNRADAIDSIVDHAQRGGDERQSGYPRR